jgi:hypothetical protein
VLRRRMVPIYLVLSGLVVLCASFGLRSPRSATAADPGLENGITATMQAVVDSYNRADLGALLPLFTDQGFQAAFFEAKDEASVDPEFFGDQLAIKSIRDVAATATVATATVEFDSGLGQDVETLTFVLVDGRWRIDNSEPGTPTLGADTTVVDLKLQEFAFVYDKDAVSGGDVAFHAQNVGEQTHEMLLVKVDDSLSASDVVDALASDEEPPFEDFGFLGILEPGQSATVGLSHPLEDGTYVFLCFLPDTDGTPHAFKGMASEFTVGSAASSGPITPPNTGDGGLLANRNTGEMSLTVLGLVLVTLGLGAALKTARR